MHPVMPMAEPTPIGETDHCAIKADYHRNCGCGASAQVGERYVALPETGGPGELASSRGRKTSKPRMCVSRNRDQPWSYRYYEITLSCPARVRAQLAFRVGDDLGVGRPSIYTTASGRIDPAVHGKCQQPAVVRPSEQPSGHSLPAPGTADRKSTR